MSAGILGEGFGVAGRAGVLQGARAMGDEGLERNLASPPPTHGWIWGEGQGGTQREVAVGIAGRSLAETCRRGARLKITPTAR